MTGRHRRPARPWMRRSTARLVHRLSVFLAAVAVFGVYQAESAAVLPCDCPASAPHGFHFTEQRIGPGPVTAHQPR